MGEVAQESDPANGTHCAPATAGAKPADAEMQSGRERGQGAADAAAAAEAAAADLGPFVKLLFGIVCFVGKQPLSVKLCLAISSIYIYIHILPDPCPS